MWRFSGGQLFGLGKRSSARGPVSWPVVPVEGNWWARGSVRDAAAGSGVAPDAIRQSVGAARLLLLVVSGSCGAGAPRAWLEGRARVGEFARARWPVMGVLVVDARETRSCLFR